MAAIGDIDEVVQYITSLHRLEAALKYRARIAQQIAAITYSADGLPFSRCHSVKLIHPKAKTISIMNHKWTVVFHVEGEFVAVDRIIPSKMIKD